MALGVAMAVSGMSGVTGAQADSFIANGQLVPDGTYPWAVSLHTSSATTAANRLCSGSHVAPDWVLTAAHCFDFNLNGTISADEFAANEVFFSLDRTLISTTTRGEVIQGTQVVLNGANDIALVRLAQPSTAPIVALGTALPTNGTAVTAAGWGDTDATGTNPDQMRRGFFSVTGSNSLDLNYTNVNNEEMCGGDSGGPVFTETGGVTRLVAVHTNSPAGCGANPGAATGSRVDAALPWIRANVPAAYGFVWAHSPSAASYTPTASYSHNSTGGVNTITRSGVGSYTVFMPGLGQPNGNVQVTAYGDTANRCKVTSWVPLFATQRIYIQCLTPGGALADSMFVAQYFRTGAGATQQQAYLWADSPFAASYTPSRFYSWNSRGGTNTVTRTGVGSYTANLPGFTLVGGNVAVTAYGNTSNSCKVLNWGVSTVNVRCFTTGGAPVDTMWTLRYTDRSVANNNQRGAYMWANDSLSASYTPSATYRFHSQGNTITAGRLGTGSYRVTLPNMAALNRTSAMVTAYGSGATSCGVNSWVGNGVGGTDVHVTCRTPAGALTNSQFTLSYLTNLP